LTGWIRTPAQRDMGGRGRRPGRPGWPSGAGGAGSSPAGGTSRFGWSAAVSGPSLQSTVELPCFKRRASTVLAAFLTETAKNRGAWGAAEPMTVSLVLVKWLGSRNARLSPTTTDRYRVAIKHIDPVIGTMKVGRLRPHHIEDLYAEGQSGSPIRRPIGRCVGRLPGYIDGASR
jgi:Phage integrase, N-terminal SAM-like domain